ncbi:MAG: chalcone isomerase family protein [Bacteroidota bacterium]
MKKNILLILFFIPVMAFSQRSAGGVTFNAKTYMQGNNLLFNGCGLREKYTIDLYAAALYLIRPSADANKIISDDQPMCMEIHIISDRVTRKIFTETVNEGFQNASHGKASDSERKLFMSYFKDEFKIGDVIRIEYVPGSGTLAVKNGQWLGGIPGVEFKKAIFSIWLGNKPADSSLKSALLGKL